MVTPPSADGSVDPVIAAAAHIAGVTRICKVGGAQAVAALAYGTQSIPRVDKIVGPGNAYVACAKRLVYGKVDIDMIAGPSEILVIADKGADPEYVAADMISQAKKKFQQSQIHLIRADILACRFDSPFDRCMVYHALSYFPDPAQLLRRLAICVKPGGRLTLAQCFGRTQEQRPQSLPDTGELARILAPWFLVDIQLSDGEKYVISGLRNDAPAVSAVPATDKR